MDYIINENGGSQTVSVVLVGEFIQELSFIVTASTDGANQAATAMCKSMTSSIIKFLILYILQLEWIILQCLGPV